MKSLLRKDFYHIRHNGISLLAMLLFFTSLTEPVSIAAIGGVLCGTVVSTTFSLDERCQWNKYALIMPVTRRDIVAEKFVLLMLCTLAGSAASLLLGAAKGLLFSGAASVGWEKGLFIGGVVGLAFALFAGGTTNLLLFRFGAEQGRLLLFLAYGAPIPLVLVLFQVLTRAEIPLSEEALLVLIYASPLPALAWNGLMYFLSCRVFARKELS